jgi:uncharacterized protein
MMDALELISDHLKGQPSQPPVHLWSPPLSGTMDMVIKANGDWVHQGGKIERGSLVKLFASILRREDDGEYYLLTPVEKWQIQVEQAPLLIVDMDIVNASADSQQIILTTNVETKFIVSEKYPLTVTVGSASRQPLPTLALDNKLFARVSRAVFYRMVDSAEERDGRVQLLSDGCWFELGEV